MEKTKTMSKDVKEIINKIIMIVVWIIMLKIIFSGIGGIIILAEYKERKEEKQRYEEKIEEEKEREYENYIEQMEFEKDYQNRVRKEY